MDHHEPAIVALNEVAHSTSHLRDPSPGKVASPRSSSNATGIDRTNNPIVDSVAGVQERSQQFPESVRIMAHAERSQLTQNNKTSGEQSTLSDNSQSATDGHDGISTPPTSTSDGFSSQSTNPEGQVAQPSQLSQLAAAQEPITGSVPGTRPNLAIATTVGQKRTADGQVKPSSSISPTSPQSHGHSRNISAVSNVSSAASSRIGEVSRIKILQWTWY